MEIFQTLKGHDIVKRFSSLYRDNLIYAVTLLTWPVIYDYILSCLSQFLLFDKLALIWRLLFGVLVLSRYTECLKIRENVFVSFVIGKLTYQVNDRLNCFTVPSSDYKTSEASIAQFNKAP